MRFVGESALTCAKNEWEDSDDRFFLYPPTPSNLHHFTSQDQVAWNTLGTEIQEQLLAHALELEGRCASRVQFGQPADELAGEGKYQKATQEALAAAAEEERLAIIRRHEEFKQLERDEYERNVATKMAQGMLRNKQ